MKQRFNSTMWKPEVGDVSLLNIWIFISAMFLILVSSNNSSSPGLDKRRYYDDTRNLTDKFTQFQCYKSEHCDGGQRICAYDEFSQELGVFDSICTVYKANCKMGTKYFEVMLDICITKIKYQEEFGDKFDWQPINRTKDGDERKPARKVLDLEDILKNDDTFDDSANITNKNMFKVISKGKIDIKEKKTTKPENNKASSG